MNIKKSGIKWLVIASWLASQLCADDITIQTSKAGKALTTTTAALPAVGTSMVLREGVERQVTLPIVAAPSPGKDSSAKPAVPGGEVATVPFFAGVEVKFVRARTDRAELVVVEYRVKALNAVTIGDQKAEVPEIVPVSARKEVVLASDKPVVVEAGEYRVEVQVRASK